MEPLGITKASTEHARGKRCQVLGRAPSALACSVPGPVGAAGPEGSSLQGGHHGFETQTVATLRPSGRPPEATCSARSTEEPVTTGTRPLLLQQ